MRYRYRHPIHCKRWVTYDTPHMVSVDELAEELAEDFAEEGADVHEIMWIVEDIEVELL